MKIKIAALIIGCLLFAGYSHASEMQDYSKLWKLWGREGQIAYMWGYLDGGGKVMMAVMDEIANSGKKHSNIPNNFYDNIRIKTATMHDTDKIIEVMSSLYRDPANSYILFDHMVLIARDSLSGKDVSKAILEARKRAIKTYELNKNNTK